MATKSITGQYECEHQSGVGMDYFTSRVDRLVLHPDGRFTLTVQDRSRLANAAQSLVKGQQASMAVPETKHEGRYTYEGDELGLYFDNGGYEPGKVSWNGDGVQLGPNFFRKVADSTLLPPTHRLKKDMDDIAKGLKIASTLGGIAARAVKTIQGTMQPSQNTSTGGQPQSTSPASSPAVQQSQPPRQEPPTTPPPAQPAAAVPPQPEARFCDQCGARMRPGKRFCNNCGARLP
ncbi:MAG: zinc ribbon domain-containing protein [Ktedonobacteraceae bacterium]|nr:zinc ribbon domain-containing protein [Ktedonobacteraceae bacterium]